MEKIEIIKTEYVAIPRENILLWLCEQDLLEPIIKNELWRLAKRIPNGEIKPKHLEKWAYFPIIDERENRQK